MSDVSNRTIVALLAVALVVSVAGTMYSVSELGQMSFDFRTIAGAADFAEGNLSLNITGTVAIQVHQLSNKLKGGVNIDAGASQCELSTGGDRSGEEWNGQDMNKADSSCSGDFNDSIFREKTFHLLENTGNLDVNVSAALVEVKDGSGKIGENACALITGINDSDGTSAGNVGCQGTGAQAGLTTLNTVSVRLGLQIIEANETNNTEVDGITTHLATSAGDKDDSAKSFDAHFNVNDLAHQPYAHGYDQSLRILEDFESNDDNDEAVVGFQFTVPADAIPGARTAIIEYSAAPDDQD